MGIVLDFIRSLSDIFVTGAVVVGLVNQIGNKHYGLTRNQPEHDE